MGSWLRQLATLAIVLFVGVIVGRSMRGDAAQPPPPLVSPELLNKRIGQLVLENVRLDEVYRRIGESAGVPVRIDTDALDSVVLERLHRVWSIDLTGLTVRQALARLRGRGDGQDDEWLDYAVMDGEIFVTTRVRARQSRQYRVYDLRNLAAAMLRSDADLAALRRVAATRPSGSGSSDPSRPVFDYMDWSPTSRQDAQRLLALMLADDFADAKVSPPVAGLLWIELSPMQHAELAERIEQFRAALSPR
jgi:hypothetical protein